MKVCIIAQKWYTHQMVMPKILIDKQTLENLYYKDGLSTYGIARKLGCSSGTIENRLEEFGISKKSASLARMRYPKKDFDGTTAEKAYLVGFRLGDLNTYKTVPTAETLVVRCHTTQMDQVDIITGAFTKFGKVSISENKGHYHVNCFLNNSFGFLAPKNESSFLWIQKPEDYAAFAAGYIDAEGNFILNQDKARFKIDSYDKNILHFIAAWLKSINIQHRLRCISVAGDIQYIKGIPAAYPKDLWRLNINEAHSLRKFISVVYPFLRHRKRIEDVKSCERNIEVRIKNGTV